MYEKGILIILGFCGVLIALIGVIGFVKKLLGTEEVDMTGKDVDRVIDYLRDNELKSCKLSMSENEIEISSDETSVVRKFNRN